MKSVHTLKAPKAIGPYSQAVVKKGFLFTAGQLGINPTTNELEKSFETQAEQVFQNLGAILAAAEMSFANVLKVTIYLKNLNDFEKLHDIYNRYFDEPYPARETVEVAHLPMNAALEVSVIASE